MKDIATKKPTKALRLAALAALVCFVLFSFGTLAVAVGHTHEHADHHCADSQCEVCVQLQHASQLLKQLMPAVVSLLAALAAAYILCSVFSFTDATAADTLVSLKVQLNN